MPGITFVHMVCLSAETASSLGQAAARLIRQRGETGYVAVYDARKTPLYVEAVGFVSEIDFVVVRKKGQTVLIAGRSTSLQGKHMNQSGLSRQDYGGLIGSLVPGGVALFSNSQRGPKDFVGAIAVAAAKPETDEEIALLAAKEIGLYTDLEPE